MIGDFEIEEFLVSLSGEVRDSAAVEVAHERCNNSQIQLISKLAERKNDGMQAVAPKELLEAASQ